MNKKSVYNALLAAGYIILVISFMQWIGHTPHPQQDSFFAPFAMVSLLTLSVAVMAYLFFYQPVLLLIENKRPEAVKVFFGTVGIFTVFVAAFFALALFIFP